MEYGTPTVAAGRTTGEVMDSGAGPEVTGHVMTTFEAFNAAVHPAGMGILMTKGAGPEEMIWGENMASRMARNNVI